MIPSLKVAVRGRPASATLTRRRSSAMKVTVEEAQSGCGVRRGESSCRARLRPLEREGKGFQNQAPLPTPVERPPFNRRLVPGVSGR